jgi:hypothetical protein
MSRPKPIREINPRATDRGLPEVRDKVVSWEEIEEGRYMPRRTRGSFPGRELG